MADVLTLTVRKIDRWLSSDEFEATPSALPRINLAENSPGKSNAPLVLAIDPRPVARLWEFVEAEGTLGKDKPD